MPAPTTRRNRTRACTAAVIGVLLYLTASSAVISGQTPSAADAFRVHCKDIAARAFANCLSIAGESETACRAQESQTVEDCESLIQGAGKVNDDTRAVTIIVDVFGRFTPKDVTVRSGDTVVWIFSERTDSIIPIASVGPIPIDPVTGKPAGFLCTDYKPYDPQDANEFTGPLPRAPSGVYLLNPKDPPYAIDSALWAEEAFTGVLMRLPWSHVHLAPGEFDWTDLDTQMDQAVRNGKLFSLAIKAGHEGTPAWIFDSRVAGASAVQALLLRDGGSADLSSGKCGTEMSLGSPADPNYRVHYLAMLEAVAEHIKSRNAWYRALAYVKPSGVNLFSAENRLPKRCWSPIGGGATHDECDCTPRAPPDPLRGEQCVCNPQVLAVQGGYTPAALREFYSLQTALLARELPQKDMSFMLIQDGFPAVNDAGEYEGQDLVNEAGEYLYPPDPARAPVFPLTSSVEQMNAILDQGAAEHGVRFVVQHNGLRMKPQVSGEVACEQEGIHPVRLGDISASGTGCPNPYVLRAGARNGSITGFQTVNFSVIKTADQLDSALSSAYDNSDAVFVEIYEQMFAQWNNPSTGVDFKAWVAKFHERRRGELFRDKAPDPFPYVHGHRFQHTGKRRNEAQVIRYVHGSKCNTANPHIGSVTITVD